MLHIKAPVDVSRSCSPTGETAVLCSSSGCLCLWDYSTTHLDIPPLKLLTHSFLCSLSSNYAFILSTPHPDGRSMGDILICFAYFISN